MEKQEDFFNMINSYKKSVLDFEDQLQNENSPTKKDELKSNKQPRKQMFNFLDFQVGLQIG